MLKRSNIFVIFQQKTSNFLRKMMFDPTIGIGLGLMSKDHIYNITLEDIGRNLQRHRCLNGV